MKEITVKVLLKDNKITTFMQACDLFEPHKVVIKDMLLSITYNKSFTKKNLNLLKQGLEMEGYGIVAVFSQKKIYYRDPSIKTISNGKEWRILDKFIDDQMNKRHTQ